MTIQKHRQHQVQDSRNTGNIRHKTPETQATLGTRLQKHRQHQVQDSRNIANIRYKTPETQATLGTRVQKHRQHQVQDSRSTGNIRYKTPKTQATLGTRLQKHRQYQAEDTEREIKKKPTQVRKLKRKATRKKTQKCIDIRKFQGERLVFLYLQQTLMTNSGNISRKSFMIPPSSC